MDSQKNTVTISEGDPGVVMCTATGVPAPTIYWFMNGALLADDGVTIVITSSMNETMESFSVTSTLNATSVMRESAFAIITCTASNGVGASSSESTQLIVQCKSLREGGMRCGRNGIKVCYLLGILLIPISVQIGIILYILFVYSQLILRTTCHL